MVTMNLLEGDCLDRLKELDDNSVDSIVTDPPYGLSFMGKAWDKSVPSQEVWEECLRVLKPGGHLLAFAGTRTQHRMAVAIEDAGFEIRDMIAWVYGCLSEDTQIVTPDGNKPYTTIKPNDLVLCYDKYNKEYSYQPVEEVYEYNIKDTAYRIQSDHTDQIVSRNHRCLVERGGREIFVFAEELGSQENIPFLEDLPNLQSTISSTHESTSNKKQNLFKGMQECNDWIKKFWRNAAGTAFWYGTSCLFSLWNLILPKQKTFGSSSKSSVFSSMQWCSSWGGMETTRSQRTPKLEAGIRESFGRKNDWGNQSKLEGRNNLQETQRESQGSEVYSMSRGIFGYGTKRWLYNGASVDNGPADRKNVESDRSGASYQSRSIRQSDRESDVVCEQQRPQTIREWSGHKTTLATVTPFEYEGKIWCVKVPTGSFVAVRNGKAFTTGNSGFPKSQNISKAIDKAAGAEREVISEKKPNSGGMTHISKTNAEHGFRPTAYTGSSDDKTAKNVIQITAPATDEAKQWDGWGTALKPALEPITVARKPLSEKTVAANVLKWGTGGINIDDCRVPINPEVDASQIRTINRNARNIDTNEQSWGMTKREGDTPQVVRSDGRFPANLIHDNSPEVVSLFPESKGQQGNVKGTEQSHTGQNGIYGEYGRVESQKRGDTGSAARFFYAAKASKSDRNEGLDDFEEKSIGAKGNVIRRVCANCGTSSLEAHLCNCEEKNWINPATKKNNHPTVKPYNLMKYLVTLVTPPNGTVLDPFMGSGSTGKAAVRCGFNFVGIELDPDYLKIAKARIEYARDNPEETKKSKSKKDTQVEKQTDLPSDLFE